MSSSEQVSHLMLRNKLQVGIYAYSLTNVPFECIGLPSSEFFYISSGNVSLSKWEDAAPMRKECVRMKDVSTPINLRALFKTAEN